MTNAYDPVDDLRKITSVQKKWRDAFSTGALDSRKWTSSIAAGGSVSVSGGALTLASGANANDETWVLSTERFSVPFRLSIGLTLSQRIANQEFYVEAVSVDRDTGVPDGQHMLGWMFDGTTVTQAKYQVQAGGMARLTSAASTIPTTASAGSYEFEACIDEAWFHGGTLDATTARANSYRRHQQAPDPNAVYKIRLRWLNGGTAPASSTNAVISTITAQDYAEITSRAVWRGTIRPLTATRTVDLIATLIGALITKPYSIPEADWSFVSALAGVTTGADTAIKAALASNRNYLTGMQLQNVGTAATEFQVKDGSTVIWRVSLPASMGSPISIDFPTPLRATTNTALNVQAVTASSAVVVNAQGYQAP